MQFLFITGTYRSGTTLVEKLLTSHPRGFVASQPFPFLYFELKKRFNEKMGISSSPYPVNPNFPVSWSQTEFDQFLDQQVLDQPFIQRALAEMEGYSGCGTPEIYKTGALYSPAGFHQIYKKMCSLLQKDISSADVSFIGTKEIIGEDFVPGMLRNGMKVILVIRDPRDLVLSANFSSRSSYVGNNRPILYTLQMWRKSVSCAIDHGSDPNLHVLRYEDLISDPFRELDKVSAFLGAPDFERELFRKGILDQYGKVWKGNSSFGDLQFIDSSSSGRYKKELPAPIIAYINSVCGPEMSFMSYEDISSFSREALLKFDEPSENIHRQFKADYSVSAVSVQNELRRMELLFAKAVKPEEIQAYFHSESTYEKLKTALP